MSAKPEPFWIERIAAGRPPRLRNPGESVEDYRIAMGWDQPKVNAPSPRDEYRRGLPVGWNTAVLIAKDRPTIDVKVNAVALLKVDELIQALVAENLRLSKEAYIWWEAAVQPQPTRLKEPGPTGTDGSQKPNDADAIRSAKAGSNSFQRASDWGRLYEVASRLAAYLGAHGTVEAKSDLGSLLLEALRRIDGDNYCPGLMPIATPAPSAPAPAPRDAHPVAPKLWLWKNFVDGRPEYWAFDNPYPTNLDNADPQTIGQPCGYAIFKPSRDGSYGRTEEQVLREMASVRASTPAPSAEAMVMLTQPEVQEAHYAEYGTRADAAAFRFATDIQQRSATKNGKAVKEPT